LGNTLGSIAFSIVTKFLNYKKILLISIVGFSISIFICTLVNSKDNFYWILISLNFVGLFGNLLCYSSLFITEEIVSSRRRSIFSSIINTGYGFCGIMYTFIFKYVQNWRYDFYILIGLTLLLGVIIWIFIYDSPRIYINKKDEKTTLKILKGIASFNGKQNEFIEEINSEEGEDLIKEIIQYNSGIDIGKITNDEDEKDSNNLLNNEDKNKIEEKITACSNFKYPSLRYKFLILCVIWFGTRSTSNCIALSSKSLPGDYYFNIIFLFIFESISYNVAGVLINIKCLGRKRTLWAQYLIITIIFFLLSFVKFPDKIELILNFFARFSAAGIEAVYWAYTLEVYPTPVRSTNFGINVTCGNIGSILSPMAYEYLPRWIFFLIFGILSIFHSFLLIFLPETVGKPMAESIEELINKK
jgi:MFS family permease